MRTPTRQVRGLGSAKSGTRAFWALRVTSVAAIPLTIGFVVIIISLLHRSHAAAVQILGFPAVAIVLLLFLITIVYHMWLGMGEIIADYVHQELVRLAALLANTVFCVVVGVSCAFALLKLSMGL